MRPGLRVTPWDATASAREPGNPAGMPREAPTSLSQRFGRAAGAHVLDELAERVQSPPRGRPADGGEPPAPHHAGDVLPVAVLADERDHALLPVEVRARQEPPVPEGEDDRLPLPPELVVVFD